MYFCLLSSSIICQIRLRLELHPSVLSLTIVAITYEGECAYWKSTIQQPFTERSALKKC